MRSEELLQSNRLNHFLKVLERISYQTEHEVFPMAALIARGNKIIVTAANKMKTHPRSGRSRAYKNGSHGGIHAELGCILSLERDYDLKNHDIYILRRKKDKSFGLAKPCNYCEDMLQSTSIRRVIFTTGETNTPVEVTSYY